MNRRRIFAALLVMFLCFVCLSSAKLMKKKEMPKEAVKQEEIKKENVKEEVIPAEKKNKETPATGERVIVKTGAVIIDGRYIEPPYEIEARDNAIWINGVLAEKMGISRKEKQKYYRKIQIQNEIYADYYELKEEYGWDQAKKKLENKIRMKREIQGNKLVDINFNKQDKLEIILNSKEVIMIDIPITITRNAERFMLNCLLGNKYIKWSKAVGKNKETIYNELIEILDKQKKKNNIEQYIYNPDKNILKIKYPDSEIWNNILIENRSNDVITLSNEECDIFDKEDTQNVITNIKNTLERGFLKVFSKGHSTYAGPGGENVIRELKEIFRNRNMSIEEKKKEIKRVYRPAEIKEEFLTEILENFNK